LLRAKKARIFKEQWRLTQRAEDGRQIHTIQLSVKYSGSYRYPLGRNEHTIIPISTSKEAD
jgi:hypothetical protein